MPRDLYISPYGPALGSGRALRTYTCVRALALLGPVDFAYVPFDGLEPSPEYAAIQGLEFHPIHPSRGMRRALRYAASCARGIPHQVARTISPELIGESMRLAQQPGRGRVISADFSVSGALLRLARRLPVIYNSHNAGPAYHAPAGQTTPWTRMLFTSFERRVLSSSAESWMVSRRDMQTARELAPAAQLRYVPNGVDVAAIEPVRPSQGPRSRLLMVGDFLYPPNCDGRDMLVQRILPLVWREQPDVRLRLVGRGSDGWMSPDHRVEVVGFVERLSDVYAQADCVVVPVNSGGGSQLKFIEALAYQVPVVATPFAAGSLEAVAGRDFLLGPDADGFASAILRVLRDGAHEVAAAGRQVAEAEYSVEAIAQRIAAAMER